MGRMKNNARWTNKMKRAGNEKKCCKILRKRYITGGPHLMITHFVTAQTCNSTGQVVLLTGPQVLAVIQSLTGTQFTVMTTQSPSVMSPFVSFFAGFQQ